MNKSAAILLFSILMLGESAVWLEPKIPFQRCLNIGNALESPKNIPWDVPMKEDYFSIIKQAGFDCIRLPVRFSDYLDGDQLEEAFMVQIDNYVQRAQQEGLSLILDFHHFEELMKNPEAFEADFLTIWEQLSKRYQTVSDHQLIFELLNEPQDQLTREKWNALLSKAIQRIRKYNPHKYIIVGSADFNSLHQLSSLRLPKDSKLIATFHYYEPDTFAFQGNPYHTGYEHLKNIPWQNSDQERNVLQQQFQLVKSWSEENHIPIFLGEFGVTKEAPAQSRKRWIEAVRKEAEANGFAWGYWEFASGFGIYDLKSGQWDKTLLDALLSSN